MADSLRSVLSSHRTVERSAPPAGFGLPSGCVCRDRANCNPSCGDTCPTGAPAGKCAGSADPGAALREALESARGGWRHLED